MNPPDLLDQKHPAEISFGGVIWKKVDREDQHVQYRAVSKDGWELHIYQYPDESYSKNMWNWQVDLFRRPPLYGIKFQCIDSLVSSVVESRETAMMCCLDAKSILIADITMALNALIPDSQYAEGFRAGQEDIKAKVAEVVL